MFPQNVRIDGLNKMDLRQSLQLPWKFVDQAINRTKFIGHVSFSGLGRTGVLIACYLIYSLRVRANDAIRFVRMKRPSAIQTRGQILCIQDFEHFVLPQMIVFPLNSTIGDRKPCSLQSCLKKQHNVLHGYEQRTFKHIPKVSFYFSYKIKRVRSRRGSLLLNLEN